MKALILLTVSVLLVAFGMGQSLVLGGAYGLLLLSLVALLKRDMPSELEFVIIMLLSLIIPISGLTGLIHQWLFSVVADDFGFKGFDPATLELVVLLVAVAIFVVASFKARKAARKPMLAYVIAIVLGLSAITIEHVAIIEYGLHSHINDLKTQVANTVSADHDVFRHDCRVYQYQCESGNAGNRITIGNSYESRQLSTIQAQMLNNMQHDDKVGKGTGVFVGANLGNAGDISIYGYATDGIHHQVVIESNHVNSVFNVYRKAFGLVSGAAWIVWIMLGFFIASHHRKVFLRKVSHEVL